MIAVGIVAASTITRGLRWANLAPGLWLLVGPALFGFPVRALASSLGAGVLVLALTPWGRGDPDRFGGGWRSLVDRERLPGAPWRSRTVRPRGRRPRPSPSAMQ